MAFSYADMTKDAQEKSKEIIQALIDQIKKELGTEQLINQVIPGSSVIKFSGREVVVIKEVTTKKYAKPTGIGMLYLVVIGKDNQRMTHWETKRKGFDQKEIVQEAVKAVAELFVEKQKSKAIYEAMDAAADMLTKHSDDDQVSPRGLTIKGIEVRRSWAVLEEEVIPAFQVSLTIAGEDLDDFIEAAQGFMWDSQKGES